MDGDKLNEMSIETLWALHLQVDFELSRRMTARKAQLEEYLKKISLIGSEPVDHAAR